MSVVAQRQEKPAAIFSIDDVIFETRLSRASVWRRLIPYARNPEYVPGKFRCYRITEPGSKKAFPRVIAEDVFKWRGFAESPDEYLAQKGRNFVVVK